jgi:hypothetical protein
LYNRAVNRCCMSRVLTTSLGRVDRICSMVRERSSNRCRASSTMLKWRRSMTNLPINSSFPARLPVFLSPSLHTSMTSLSLRLTDIR